MSWKLPAFSAVVMLLTAGCGRQAHAVLKVLHAGSLIVPFQQLKQAFEAQNPGVEVQLEAYGSATAIRQVTELGRSADVIASSDYRLIDELMIISPRKWADWNVLFARNELCIVYQGKQRAITQAGWAEVLGRPDVRVGMSDPNQDPCGYRSLFCLYLADAQLGRKGLFDGLVRANSNDTAERSASGDAVIRVPERVEYRGRLVLRPKETDLVALIEAGAIDYLLIYRSVAVQHKLDFLALPDEVNLGNPALAAEYARVSALQSADAPGGSTRIVAGPIAYGLTVPSSAPQPRLAEAFVRLVLSEDGRRIMEASGQPALVPALYSPASRTGAAPFQLAAMGK
jgi:molybdate/tungstate transport system substrate-binding protein